MIRVILGEQTETLWDNDPIIFNEANFSIDAVREELETPSLFGESKTIALLYVLEAYHDDALALLEQYAGNVATIILRERELGKKDEQVLADMGATIVAGKKSSVPKTEFNIWKLTDALLARDKKNAWLLYREAIEQGIAPEEIGGILWWQIKTLLLVSKDDTAGMKPFSISKAKQSLKKYTAQEIEQLAQRAVAAIHEPRAGNGKAEEMLEAFILSL